jgi:hypothetical protein
MKKVAITGWAGFIRWYAIRQFAKIHPFYLIVSPLSLAFDNYSAIFRAGKVGFGYKFDERIRTLPLAAELLTFAASRTGRNRLCGINIT